MNTLKIFIICIGFSINLSCIASDVEQLPDFKKLVQDEYITPFKNADTDCWMQVFADDAVGMHNTLPPLIGKDAVRQFGDMVAANVTIEQMDIVVEEVRVNGSWALTRGSFVSKFVPKTVSDSASIPPSKGKFILLWERQTDGTWKVILDMGNSSES
jgi:ketosteroid isomerase-like protein